MIALYDELERAILETNPDSKVAQVNKIWQQWNGASYTLTLESNQSVLRFDLPGLPAHLKLVDISTLPKRGMGSVQGRAAKTHAFVHIEFMAINLALDIVYRFPQVPSEFITDWLSVAREEAYHFELLSRRLCELGYSYGDFDAHDGLWVVARKTEDDILRRLALVPRFHEARGIDVTPSMIQQFRQIKDEQTARILEIILRDEIGHVQFGSQWFRWFAEKCGLEPEKAFVEIVHDYLQGALKGPFNLVDRKKAGFSEQEMSRLQQFSS